jgi:hypothetical protein
MPVISAAARADVSMPPESFLAEHHAYLQLMLDLAERGNSDFDVIHNNSLHYLPVAMARSRYLHTAYPAHSLAGIRHSGWTLPGRLHRRQRSHGAGLAACGRRDTVIPNGVELNQRQPGPGGGPQHRCGRCPGVRRRRFRRGLHRPGRRSARGILRVLRQPGSAPPARRLTRGVVTAPPAAHGMITGRGGTASQQSGRPDGGASGRPSAPAAVPGLASIRAVAASAAPRSGGPPLPVRCPSPRRCTDSNEEKSHCQKPAGPLLPLPRPPRPRRPQQPPAL